MNTLNFQIPMLNIEGVEVNPPRSLASALAEFIGLSTKGRALKLYGWYKTLQTDGVLTLDDADMQELKEMVESSEQMFIFVKGQILNVMLKK